MLEKSVIDEMRNIAENAPVFPGDTLAHATANECVARGWADRNSDGDFVATEKGREAIGAAQIDRLEEEQK